MATNKLTGIKVKKNRASNDKISDNFLNLLVKNNTTNCWRFVYRITKKLVISTYTIDTYPQIGFKVAHLPLYKCTNTFAIFTQLKTTLNPKYSPLSRAIKNLNKL